MPNAQCPADHLWAGPPDIRPTGCGGVGRLTSREGWELSVSSAETETLEPGVDGWMDESWASGHSKSQVILRLNDTRQQLDQEC